MERFQDRHVLAKILQESILQMCKVSVGLHSNISIDGIICIATPQEDEREIIVKIHEQVNRSPDPEPPKNIVPTPKVPQNFRCNDDTVFGKFPESGKTPLHVQNSRDFLLCGDDNDDLFGDLAAIKAIMPLNRSESLEAQGSHTVGMDTVVNLIDEDTIGFSERPVPCSESMVMVKPDPGNAAPSCTVTSVCPTTTRNCSVASVIQTGPSPTPIPNSLAMAFPHVGGKGALVDESSDDDLRIEKLKAGRTRKHKRYPSESSNRMSPTDFINNDVPIHSGEETHLDLVSRSLTCEVDDDDDEAEITASSTASNKGVDIKPILSRKQTPTSSQSSPTQIAMPPPTTAYTNITPTRAKSATPAPTPTSYTNIAPSEMLVEENPTPLITSSPMKSPLPIKTTGMTVAQQLQILRQQRLVHPETMEPTDATEHIKVDDIPMSQNLGSKSYTCTTCLMTFAPFKKFHMHMYRQHGAFPCPCCDKMFTHRYSRNRHIVTHHAGVKTFTCPFCNKKYVRADTLKLHVQKQHPDTARDIKIHYSYAHGKQLYEPDSTATGDTPKASPSNTSTHAAGTTVTTDKLNIVSMQQEPEVVYNRNLPSKFETVDSESSNSADAGVHNEELYLSQAQVVSQDTAVIHSGAHIQYLKMESMDTAEFNTVSHEDIMSMHDLDHDDIMDMIEISDDEGEASGRTVRT